MMGIYSDLMGIERPRPRALALVGFHEDDEEGLMADLGAAGGDDQPDPKSIHPVPRGATRDAQQGLNAKGYRNQNGARLVEDGIWGYGTQYAFASAVEHLSNVYGQKRSMQTDPAQYQGPNGSWQDLRGMIAAFPQFRRGVKATVQSGKFTRKGIETLQGMLRQRGYRDFEGKEIAKDGKIGPRLRSAFASAVQVANQRRVKLTSGETPPYSDNLDDWTEADAIDLVHQSDSPLASVMAAEPVVKPAPPPGAPKSAVVAVAPPAPPAQIATIKQKARKTPRATRPETVKAVEKIEKKRAKERKPRAPDKPGRKPRKTTPASSKTGGQAQPATPVSDPTSEPDVPAEVTQASAMGGGVVWLFAGVLAAGAYWVWQRYQARVVAA